MALKYLLLGFFVKVITGFDDTLTHIPVMASVTKTRRGRLAFALGIVLAISTAILMSIFFAQLIHDWPYARLLAASLLFLLAVAICCDWFVHEPRKRVELKIKRNHAISAARFTKLIGIGYVSAFATVIDDIIAYAPLFLVNLSSSIFAVMGIFLALAVELFVVLNFSKYVMKFKYKDELAAGGLTLLGVLLVVGAI